MAIENARLQLALIIPTDTPIAVPNDAIGMLPLTTDKHRGSNILTKIFSH